MATKKIRQGDDVIVLTGRDKGKRGTVLRILSSGKALVDILFSNFFLRLPSSIAFLIQPKSSFSQ